MRSERTTEASLVNTQSLRFQVIAMAEASTPSYVFVIIIMYVKFTTMTDHFSIRDSFKNICQTLSVGKR